MLSDGGSNLYTLKFTGKLFSDHDDLVKLNDIVARTTNYAKRNLPMECANYPFYEGRQLTSKPIFLQG